MELLQQLQDAVGDTFRLERELGPGGMSRLFLAHESSLERTVVLKVLPPEFSDPVSSERFRREVRLIARLQHPHVVPILGTGSAHGLTWYVMPYVPGESLHQLLQRTGAVPVDQVVTILREAADALAFAHRLGILHRDIKPANILISEGHAVVADFGIARAAAVADSQTEDGRLTGTGMWLGTVGYMAPEQATGDVTVDGRADIYALAVVGYQMLTGRMPFEGPTGAHVVAAQMRDTPAPPSAIRSGIDSTVNDAIVRGMARDPEHRFRTAEELRDALVLSRAPGVRSGRRSTVVVGALAIAAAAVGWFAFSAPRTEGVPASQETMAIAPFTVLDPALGLWREGLVDVLSRSLDGMGPIRTVGAATAIQRWTGHADAVSAASFGRELHARYVLFGVMQPSGSAETLMRATLLEVEGGRPVADIEFRDSVARIDRIADTLSVRIIRLLASDRRLALSPRATLIGSRSLVAIKEFLQGEQLHRAGLFDSAAVHFQRAISLDSTFALAYWGLANTRGWIPGRSRDDTKPYLVAGRLNIGLGPRDSMIVLHDSIQTWLNDTPELDSIVREKAQKRALALLRTITTRYPEDPIGWYRLSEALVHRFILTRAPFTVADVAEVTDRAIVADSGNSEAHLHAMQAANTMGKRERVLSYAAALDRHSGNRALKTQARFLTWLMNTTDDADLRRFVDTVNQPVWYGAMWVLLGMRYTDSTATVARLLRVLSQSGRQWPGVPASPQLASLAAQAFEYHGQLKAARALAPAPVPTAAAALARIGILEADNVARQLRTIPSESLAVRTYLVPFWAWRGDSNAIIAIRRDLASRAPAQDARTTGGRAFTMRVIDGFLALARADTQSVVRILAPLPFAASGDFLWLTWHAQVAPAFAHHGRVPDALRLAEFPGPALFFGVNTAVDAERLMITARIAEQAGQHARARDYYAQLDKAWAGADPEFTSLRQEVRAALARLGNHRGQGGAVPDRH